jgi:hypothetical protein
VAAPLAKRLQIKAASRVLLVNEPDGYRQTLGGLPDGVELQTSGGTGFDVVQAFVVNSADLDRRWPEAVAALRDGGVLWISYPKKTSGVDTDLDRDTLRRRLEGTGWRPVSQISVDEIWSALRFRPAEDVGR